MSRQEKAIFTNMCMLSDGRGNVLVLDRRDPVWGGLTFPGGHVEPGESFVDSVIREMQEETGLTIHRPVLCGLKQWMEDAQTRYVVLLYKAESFEGELSSSEEGDVFWMDLEDMKRSRLAPGMEFMLQVFLNDSLNEHYLHLEHGEWKNTLK